MDSGYEMYLECTKDLRPNCIGYPAQVNNPPPAKRTRMETIQDRWIAEYQLVNHTSQIDKLLSANRISMEPNDLKPLLKNVDIHLFDISHSKDFHYSDAPLDSTTPRLATASSPWLVNTQQLTPNPVRPLYIKEKPIDTAPIQPIPNPVQPSYIKEKSIDSALIQPTPNPVQPSFIEEKPIDPAPIQTTPNPVQPLYIEEKSTDTVPLKDRQPYSVQPSYFEEKPTDPVPLKDRQMPGVFPEGSLRDQGVPSAFVSYQEPQQYTVQTAPARRRGRPSGSKTRRCNMCNKNFHSSYKLKVHMRTHSGEKPYPCTQCLQGFSNSNDRAIHMVTEACLPAERFIRRTGQGWECTRCVREVSLSRDQAELHAHQHQNDKGLYCPVCHIKFRRCNPNILVKHVREHHQEYMKSLGVYFNTRIII